MRRLLLPLLATALVTSGCSAFAGESADDELRVTAAFYPLQYVTQRVVGDLADVTSLTTPGKEPHDLELTVRETAEITEADLVVHEAGFQPTVDESVEQNATGEVVDAAEVVDLITVSEEDHAEEDHAHEEGAEHTTDDGHDHDHGDSDVDPHFWLDPQRMATLGDAIADRLSEIDPDHASTYADNAAALRSDLEALDASYVAGLADCERDTIVVSHDAFGYLDRYGLRVAAVAGLSPDAEPTPADLGRLQQLIADDGITTVFGERLASPRLTEALAEDAGVTTAVLDPIEGLTDDTADETYLSLMEQNLEALRSANSCR